MRRIDRRTITPVGMMGEVFVGDSEYWLRRGKGEWWGFGGGILWVVVVVVVVDCGVIVVVLFVGVLGLDELFGVCFGDLGECYIVNCEFVRRENRHVELALFLMC